MAPLLASLLTVGLQAGAAPAPPPAGAPPASEGEARTGIIYGGNHAYALTAPAGWVLDNQVWADQGVFAVFYPKGSGVEGPWVAYSRYLDRNPGGPEAQALVDLRGIQASCPGYAWTRQADLVIPKQGHAVVFSTHDDPAGNSEWLAYLGTPTGTVLIALVTKRPADLPKLRRPFEELVASYVWFTDKVEVSQPPEAR